MASVLRNVPPYCKCRERVLILRQTAKIKGLRTFATDSTGVVSKEGKKEVNVKFSNGQAMTISSGKLAKLADGCALVTYKNTTVVATVVSKESLKGTGSFTPLTVSYLQKAAALGRIPLNFLRREIGQTEQEILTSRMIDRSIRPLFPENFNWETQVTCSPLAIDGSNFPDVLGINAASAALAVSNVPWNGPVGAVRVGLKDGNILINPTKMELMESQLNLVMTTRDSKVVTMIEGVAKNIIQGDLFRCMKQGMKECQKIVSEIASLRNLSGKIKRTFEPAPINPSVQSAVESLSVDRLKSIFQDHTHDKQSRDNAVFSLRDEVVEKLKADFPEETASVVGFVFNNVCKNVFRELIFETDIRCDGRTLRDLRKITCEVDLYEPLHGSALFQRGQTQVLCTVALDSPNSALRMDKISMLTSGLKEKNFFVHYEFPPFATNETGRRGPIGRREIGHGILAEKALQSNIPEKFPFTIRLTSEVLESNGSSSMATVCGGTLALLDAGVPLTNPCAGVAMGFLSKRDGEGEISEYKILTDLLGIEDYLGEMDFKIAGTKKAYTALQLDVKNDGIPLQIIYEILIQAKDSIGDILSTMRATLPEVRSQKKKNWPEKQSISVPVHMRSKFLGPGGINVKRLEMTTGVEVSEDVIGDFVLFAPNSEALKEANAVVAELLKSTEEVALEFGGVYTALITEVRDTGCMVTLYPNMKPAHIPLSQLDMRQVNHPSALGLQVGQEIKVKYFGRDPMSGVMRLSRKVLMGPASEVARQLHRNEPQPAEETDSGQAVASGKQNS